MSAYPMKVSPEHNARIAQMSFAEVYAHYVKKVEKKRRTQEELRQVISWLTGFSEAQIDKFIADRASFESFFEAAKLHPNAPLIKGVISGYRIEDIDIDLTRQVRYLDKRVDELAKGRKMERVLRVE